MYKVIMSSEVYGSETFDYDTFREAKAGIARLRESAIMLKDGVERLFFIEEVEASKIGRNRPVSKRKYDVHIFATIRVKIPDVEAESQEEAIKKAEESVDFENLLLNVGGHETESADEMGYYLVDEVGDKEHDNTHWHSGQFSINRYGNQYPSRDVFENLLSAAKGVIDGWEHNLTSPINELAAAIKKAEEAGHA